MSDCRFGVSPVNYPDPDPDPGRSQDSLVVDFISHAIPEKRPHNGAICNN